MVDDPDGPTSLDELDGTIPVDELDVPTSLGDSVTTWAVVGPDGADMLDVKDVTTPVDAEVDDPDGPISLDELDGAIPLDELDVPNSVRDSVTTWVVVGPDGATPLEDPDDS